MSILDITYVIKCIQTFRIKRTSYSLGEQYLARENVATSQSVCILIVLQFVCISVSSFGVNYIKSIKSTLSDEEYNKIAPFVVVSCFSDLCTKAREIST